MTERVSPLENLYSQRYVPISRNCASEIQTSCEVCAHHTVKALYELSNTDMKLVECENCHLKFLYPFPTPEEIREFYPEGYYGTDGKKFTGLVEKIVRLIGARHARFLAKQINCKGRVLDVGCGRGVTLLALNHLGLEAHGFEVSDAAIEGLGDEIKTRVESSLNNADYPSEFFDEVIIWHVLEHLPNPHQIILECHRLLKSGGKLVIAVPNASSWQACWAKEAWFHLDPPRHLYHFPLETLEKLLTLNGFEIVSRHHFSLRQNPFGWIQSALNRIHKFPQNGLYYLLHRKKQSVNSVRPFSLWTRIVLYSFFIFLAPFALLLSIFAATFRQGATVHVVAQKTT